MFFPWATSARILTWYFFSVPISALCRHPRKNRLLSNGSLTRSIVSVLPTVLGALSALSRQCYDRLLTRFSFLPVPRLAQHLCQPHPTCQGQSWGHCKK